MKKSIIYKLSPFNNYDDMPAPILVLKKLLAFFICFVLGMLAGNGVIIGIMIACGKDLSKGETFSDNVMALLGLYCMAAIIAVSILYWKLIEKRKLSEMGVTRNVSGWFIGAGIGALLIIVSVSVIMLTGTIKFSGLSGHFNIAMFLLMFGAYAVQGASEEFLSRGVVFCSLKDKVSLPVAVGANALVFIIPHMDTLFVAEPLFIISGTIILVIISCVFSFITLRTKNIWAACGLHTVWNFCLECIFGMTVSGSESAGVSVINMRTVGKNLLNGGVYGIEASAVTAVTTGAAAILLWNSYKKVIKERQA
ncbi:MAG: CPBP family intramembrane metalloprotease [Ruminococcus sp.]|nr:CPBP family intramembrane metalloprotease [Ruminococcus sp.]